MKAWSAVLFVAVSSVAVQTVFGEKCSTTAKGYTSGPPYPMNPVNMEPGIPSYFLDLTKTVCPNGRKGVVVTACDCDQAPDVVIANDMNSATIIRHGNINCVGTITVTEYCN